MAWIRHHSSLFICCFLALLYVMHVGADSIAGLFGILWSDEGAYLLPAKMQVLYGTAHLFSEDRYLSEYTAPLLHAYGLLMITKHDAVTYVRWGMVFQVLLGQLIVARLAWRYHGHRDAGIRCLLVLMLTPLLYFYARIGLSEGMQFLLMAIDLWLLFELYYVATVRKAMIFSSASAAVIALIFLGKVTSVGVCVGLSVAMLVAILQHQQLRFKWLILAITVLSGIATLGVLYGLWIYGYASVWHETVFGKGYDENVPRSLWSLLDNLSHHYYGLHYFLPLMPIFALGFAGLLLAADKQRGYLWLLWIAAVVTLAVESFFPGEIRRCFFELSLMMVLAGFTIDEYIRRGLAGLGWNKSRMVSVFIVSCFVVFAVYFWIRALIAVDPIYRLVGALWLVLLGFVFLCRNEAFSYVRKIVVVLVAICALLPMVYQVFFAPRTIESAIVDLERLVPTDTVITGVLPAWVLLGLKRPLIFTNCVPDGFHMANDPRTLPKDRKYLFMGIVGDSLEKPECLPIDFDRYTAIGDLYLFYPFNKGSGHGGSASWVWILPFRLFEGPEPSQKPTKP